MTGPSHNWDNILIVVMPESESTIQARSPKFVTKHCPQIQGHGADSKLLLRFDVVFLYWDINAQRYSLPFSSHIFAIMTDVSDADLIAHAKRARDRVVLITGGMPRLLRIEGAGMMTLLCLQARVALASAWHCSLQATGIFCFLLQRSAAEIRVEQKLSSATSRTTRDGRSFKK